MEIIYKYAVAIEDEQKISMRRNATILSVQMQGNVPFLWVRCNPNVGEEARVFIIRGTGQTLPHNVGRFIGTFQVQGGALVFHLFEATP